MAGRGPAPKPDDTRARRNKPPAPAQNLSVDGELRGPTLPKGMTWPEPTKKWWLNWRKSAQAKTFVASDWDFLLETALLHAAFWDGDKTVAAELRLRVAKFGATPEDRLRLRMNITQPDEDGAQGEPEKGSTAASASKERYGGLRVVS